MSLPYPQALATLLVPTEGTNRSLVWDRGAVWNPAAADKGRSDFLRRFVAAFREPADFAAFLARRDRTLTALGAHRIPATTSTRLLVGLGLPHLFETGFLFDRLTGCPYLPGSSVKGLLRAAAREVARGRLSGDRDFWQTCSDDLFGPETAGGVGAAKGKAEFFDAFPDQWPKLEIDVLTPHYQKYYESGSPPGDWEDPIPVPFLSIAPETTFRFYFRLSAKTRNDATSGALEALLTIALDWLGIGGKTSAGYGVFKPKSQAELPPPAVTKGVVLRSTRVR